MRRLAGRPAHLGGRFSHPVNQAAVLEARGSKAQNKNMVQNSLGPRLERMQGVEEGFLREVWNKAGNEILSGFVVTAGMTTKPDARGSFAH